MYKIATIILATALTGCQSTSLQDLSDSVNNALTPKAKVKPHTQKWVLTDAHKDYVVVPEPTKVKLNKIATCSNDGNYDVDVSYSLQNNSIVAQVDNIPEKANCVFLGNNYNNTLKRMTLKPTWDNYAPVQAQIDADKQKAELERQEKIKANEWRVDLENMAGMFAIWDTCETQFYIKNVSGAKSKYKKGYKAEYKDKYSNKLFNEYYNKTLSLTSVTFEDAGNLLKTCQSARNAANRINLQK